MTKRPRSSLVGTVKPAQSHNNIDVQAGDDVIAQLHDDDVPDAVSEPDVVPARAARPKARSRRAPAAPVEEVVKDYAHRSLYAMPDTLDLIRRLAFEERTSAQALYREGLFLMLKAKGKLPPGAKSGADM